MKYHGIIPHDIPYYNMIRVLPAGPQPQRISEDIPDSILERIAENI